MKKFSIVTVLMMLTLPLACDRYLDSQDPVRSLPAPIPIPTSLQAVVDDGTVTLSWELTDSSKAARFRVYVAESEADEYILRDSTTAYSITLSGLLLNRQSFLRVTMVTTSGVESEVSVSVSATPAHFSISIDNDSEYTRQRGVQVRINSGVSALYVQISEQQDFADAVWESFGSNKSFELSDDDGLKVVYVRLQFGDGSETGQPLSDDITLDTDSEIDTLYFFPPDDNIPMVEGDEAIFRMLTAEAEGEASVSFGSVRDLELYDDGTNGDAIADDAIYTNRYTVPFGAYAFDEIVTGSFTDAAGNSADDVTAEVLMNINMPPAPVELAVSFGVNTSTIVFSWTTSSESDFESYRLINLAEGIDKPLMIATSASTNRYEMSSPVAVTTYVIYVFDRHGESELSDPVDSPAP